METEKKLNVEMQPQEEQLHCCRECKLLSPVFNIDDSWFCRKGHNNAFLLDKLNNCMDFEEK
jgi:hypothetical protein